MDANMWASLPHDLLIEIFRLLGATAVIRSAGACRPWRRAIIAGASCLDPRPDRFNPNLLIGFFHRPWLYAPSQVWLQYVPGPFENVLACGDAATNAAAWFVERERYCLFNTADNPLSSRDGFLLLGGSTPASDLCLCNPLAGSRRIIPAAAFDARTYVLVTGHDYDDSPAAGAGDETAVWILAVEEEWNVTDGVGYQIFFSKSGEWGPVKRSAKFKDEVVRVYVDGDPGDVVVCRGAVYWLLALVEDHRVRRRMFAMDVRTEQTWMTELPKKYMDNRSGYYHRLVPATSMDGRLSLIFQLQDDIIEVWVLVGDGEWSLQRNIDLHRLAMATSMHHLMNGGRFLPRVNGFCPRSGFLFSSINYKDILIDVNMGSLRPPGRFEFGRVNKFPYEMDWSTYISRMKYF